MRSDEKGGLLQGYRICILPNWARRRVRKVSSKAARMRFPFMDPLEPSSLARFRLNFLLGITSTH